MTHENTTPEPATLSFRALRHSFMVAAMKTGREALGYIDVADPDLAKRVHALFPNPGRAAFWLALESDPASGLTPLLDLARGNRQAVIERLDHYVSPFHVSRTP